MLAKIKAISALEFENLTYDLIQSLGLRNATWRSPGADGGRDIEGISLVEDLAGEVTPESWFVECKRYANSLDWPTIYGKLAYAASNSADVLLIVTTALLTPQCRSEISKWNAQKSRPRIRYLDGPRLIGKLECFPLLVAKYALSAAGLEYSISFKSIASLLADLCDSAEAELEAGGPSVSAEAAFDVARIISKRVAELEVYRDFRGKDFVLSSSSLPPWLRLDGFSTETLPTSYISFLSYIRFLLRAKEKLTLRASDDPGFFGKVDLRQGAIEFVHSGSLDELAHWCQLTCKVTERWLFIRSSVDG